MPTSEDIKWFKRSFGSQITEAVAGTPFDLDMIVAIACQETGYIWSNLRKLSLPLDRILALCVGDTIDYQGPGKGRQAFPRNRDQLESEPQGRKMFEIARKALEDMAVYVPGYQKVVENKNKFCHGFGVFQRDLQFFKDDPDYFLERRYEQFPQTLDHCLKELRRGLKKLQLQDRAALTDMEFAQVAIAYNTGRFDPARGLKQGYFDGSKYYGELIFDYLRLSRSASVEEAVPLGRYAVIARNGLKLRGGPGTTYDSEKTLSAGTELVVMGSDTADPRWVLVDLEGDGLFDGFVLSSFLAPIPAHAEANEDANEPN